jgi:hypothetical protein
MRQREDRDRDGDDDDPREEAPEVVQAFEQEEGRTDGQHGHRQERRRLLAAIGGRRRPCKAHRQAKGDDRDREGEAEGDRAGPAGGHAHGADRGEEHTEGEGGIHRQRPDERLLLEQPDVEEQCEQGERLAQEEQHDDKDERDRQGDRPDRHGSDRGDGGRCEADDRRAAIDADRGG